MYQLRNAINRVNVVQKPLDRFDACEDWLWLLNATFQQQP